MWNTSPKKERCTKRNETKAHRSRPREHLGVIVWTPGWRLSNLQVAIGTRNRSFRLGEGLGVALVQENIDCSPDIGLFTHRDGTTQHEGLFLSPLGFQVKKCHLLFNLPVLPGTRYPNKFPRSQKSTLRKRSFHPTRNFLREEKFREGWKVVRPVHQVLPLQGSIMLVRLYA